MDQAFPHLDLASVAQLVRAGAKQAVRDEMDARDRYVPHEIGEAWLRVAVVQELRRHLRMSGLPRYRVHDDCLDCDVGDVGASYPRPIDVVVFYPAEAGGHTRDASRPVGLIEIRRNVQEMQDDIKHLSRLADAVAGWPPLQWVMELVFIDGSEPERVIQRQRQATAVAQTYGLTQLTPCEPEAAPLHDGAADAHDAWFDLACYGRAIAR